MTDADRAAVRWLLSAIGSEDELQEESHLDLMTAVPGSGTAYPALLATALADFLRANGIAEVVAWRAAKAVICDAPQVLAGRISQAPEIIEAYLAYEGTTAAGINAAQSAGFVSGLQAALKAAVIKGHHMDGAEP